MSNAKFCLIYEETHYKLTAISKLCESADILPWKEIKWERTHFGLNTQIHSEIKEIIWVQKSWKYMVKILSPVKQLFFYENWGISHNLLFPSQKSPGLLNLLKVFLIKGSRLIKEDTTVEGDRY